VLTEYFLPKVIDGALDTVRDYARAQKAQLKEQVRIEDALNEHLRYVREWSGSITFKDLRATKALDEVFVELDLYAYPRRVRIDPGERVQVAPLEQIVSASQNHIVLLGQPGAGKTTSLKHLCRKLLTTQDFLPETRFPLLLPLRHLGPQVMVEPDPLYCAISRIFGISIGDPKSGTAADAMAVRAQACMTLLNALSPLVVIDGFDEVAPGRRTAVLRDARALAMLLEGGLLILTSRTGEFGYAIDNTDQYEIAPLLEQQIAQFARNWLDAGTGDSSRSTSFLAAIKRSPFADTSIRPLTLAHLCAIYERSQAIPTRPKTVYKKIVSLLLEEWDEQRGISPGSRLDRDFPADQQFAFLCHLAYELSVKGHTATFSDRALESAYGSICKKYDLAPGAARRIVDQLESNTGLLLSSSFEHYEFAHKSLQEYLTAEHIVRLPKIPRRQVVMRLPQETAIAVALSADPSSYLAEVVLHRFWEQSIESYDDRMLVLEFVDRLCAERAELSRDADCALAIMLLFTLCLLEPSDISRREAVQDLCGRVFDSLGLDLIGQHYRRLADEVRFGVHAIRFVLAEGNVSGCDYHQNLPRVAWLPASIVDAAELV